MMMMMMMEWEDKNFYRSVYFVQISENVVEKIQKTDLIETFYVFIGTK